MEEASDTIPFFILRVMSTLFALLAHRLTQWNFEQGQNYTANVRIMFPRGSVASQIDFLGGGAFALPMLLYIFPLTTARFDLDPRTGSDNPLCSSIIQ